MMTAMRNRTVMLAIGWTVAVVAIVLFVGGGVAGPACARLVNPVPTCAAEIAAANDRLWWTHTLPMLVVIGGGYVLIGLDWLRRRLAAPEPAAGSD